MICNCTTRLSIQRIFFHLATIVERNMEIIVWALFESYTHFTLLLIWLKCDKSKKHIMLGNIEAFLLKFHWNWNKKRMIVALQRKANCFGTVCVFVSDVWIFFAIYFLCNLVYVLHSSVLLRETGPLFFILFLFCFKSLISILLFWVKLFDRCIWFHGM